MTDEEKAAPVTATCEKETEDNQNKIELLTGSNKENVTDKNVNIAESTLSKGSVENNDVDVVVETNNFEMNNESKVVTPSGDVADQENCDYDKHTDESTKEVLDDIENLLNDEEFIESLNVVDAWEGEDEAKKRKSKEKNKQKEADKKNQDKTPDKNTASRRAAHENVIGLTPKNFRDRREKRSERIRHDRRDPSKSNKDIERDKQRSKKDAESKILAEKEKAIKKILDSDTVVPPGTESEAIEKIAEKSVEDERRSGRSRERRRSVDRLRRSPMRRSPLRLRPSPAHRRLRSPSPFRYRSPMSPERRRSPRGYRRRSISPERRSSERRRRIEIRERDTKFRRSRSPDRRRSSRTPDRRRRYSRSPDRREDRWRSRSRSRSRSPTRRGRKRSPFINEIARQLEKDALMAQPAPAQQFLPTPPVSQTLLPSPNFAPAPHTINSAPYMAYDPSNPTSVNYEPPGLRMEFPGGPPVMYNNQRILVQVPPTGPSPQPVPAPVQTMYNHIRGIPGPARSPSRSDSALRASPSGFKSDEYRPFSKSPSRERLKTPEPPVISDTKLFEKTSLSSLLEASVSAKESSSPAVLYPGFRPEILKNCERALQELPAEDPRLKMTGRFFFDPTLKEPSQAQSSVSNSPLLKKGPNKIFWEDDNVQPNAKSKSNVMTHQKICQTEEVEVDHKDCQTEIEMASIGIQVYPQDLMPQFEEKRPIQERLDWNKREFQPEFEFPRREPDLRESLNARERIDNWPQPTSPRLPIEPRNFGPVPPGPIHPMDFGHRERPMEDPRDPVYMNELYRAQMASAQYDRNMYQMQMAAPIDELERRRMEEFRIEELRMEERRMEERRMEERRMEERRMEERRMEESMMREEEEMEWQARRNMGGKLGTLYKLRARGRPMRGRGAPYGGF